MGRRMERRHFLAGAASAIAAMILGEANAADGPREIRVGYQKIGALPLLKSQGLLEKRFAADGVTVRWVEFAFGPPLLEAMSAGAVDYGYTGDSPPIFAQAGRANILYAAAIPARGYGQAIIVPAESTMKSLVDLKGKRIGVAKGSSGHNLLVAALESADIAWRDITPLYLAPADAAAAFSRGAIDAWSIWDPFLAIAEIKQRARPLPLDPAISAQNSFFLVNREFAHRYPATVAAINQEVGKATQWADQHRAELATLLAQVSGVDFEAQKKAVDRSEFTFGPLNDQVLSQQQAVADRFQRAGLIPAPIRVRDIVWDWKSAT
jgi:sulfonate transport system substrate-binding protein